MYTPQTSFRQRLMQVMAWFVFGFCSVIILTGVLVGQTRTSVAQEPAAQEQAAVNDEVAVNEQAVANDQAAPPEAAQAQGDAEAEAGEAAPQMLKRKVGSGPKSSFFSKVISFLGIFALIFVAWLMSSNRRRVNWKLVGIGVSLQLVFALMIFYMPGGQTAFAIATSAVMKLLDFTAVGSDFVFSSFVTNNVEVGLINFAFAVLPTIIFFSSLMTILYHLGVMQKIVHLFAWIMQRTMGISGAESTSAAANIFVGQTEAPLVVKPYVNDMTVSELMVVMTGGFATVAGGVMAIYVGMLEPSFPDIAGHLIAASVMSAPAALVIAKVMYPETEVPKTMGLLELDAKSEDVNVLDAASRGAAEGLKLALNVGAMLLAFLALVALVDHLLGLPSLLHPSVPAIAMKDIFGVVFWPFAWIMGVPFEDCYHIARLLGEKMVINELVAYASLAELLNDPNVVLQDRSVIIATYALCGFANFGSIGIQLGGIGGIAPDRKADLARIAMKAMIGGTLAAFMTATIAGILI